MATTTPTERAERSKQRRQAFAARPSVVVSLTDDANWFAPFLREVLPQAISVPIVWDEPPGQLTSLLVETPLRTRDYGQLVPESCVRMLVSGEPFSVAEFGDHDLILDTKDEESQRPAGVAFVYVPFYVTSLFERRLNSAADLLQRSTSAVDRGGEREKSRFAAFLYEQCRPHREEFFDALHSYRPVDALGRCRFAIDDQGVCGDRATNRDLYTAERTYLDDAVQRYRDYRFVVAIENDSLNGYVTEKLINAMLAGAVPIYWGAPDVDEHFDERSFIDVGSFASINDCVEYVARVDQDPELYRSILERPWLRGNRLNEYLDLSSIVTELARHLGPRRSWRSRVGRER
ncbi:MAG: glycosyltransferase family 10 domain-containing protein [Gaiellaceae bacterium]